MTRSRFRPTLGLQAYLAALIVLFTATAVVSSLYVHAEAELAARREVTREVQFAADLAASEVATSLASLETTIAQTAAIPSLVGVFDHPSSSCNLAFGAMGVFQKTRLDFIALDGSVICSSSREPSQGLGYGDSAWFASAVRGVTFAGPIPDPRTGGTSAVSAVPVPGHGVIAGFVDLAGLGPVLGSRFAGPDDYEFLITTADRKTAVGRSVDSSRWVGVSLDGTPFAATVGQSDGRDVDGAPRVYAQAPVGGYDWRIYAGVDTGLALTSVSDLVGRNLWINAAGLILLLVGTLVVYRLITKPIHDLSRSVRAGMTAEVQVPIVVSGATEIVTLGEDFNQLIAKVQAELVERRHAESRVRGMIDASLDAVVGMNREGQIIEWSQQAETTFGWSKEKALGAPLADLIIPERYRSKHLAGLERYKRTGDGPVLGKRLELEACARDGHEFPIELSITPVTTTTGEVFSAFIRDISERRAAEEQRLGFEQRLRQAERLESVGRLVGGIAHDFNNLLAIVLNYTEFIAERLAPDDVNQPDLAQIRGAAERATRFTTQLLTFARRGAVHLEDLDLNELIQSLHGLLSRTLPESIVVEMRLPKALWSVRADRGQLEQLLLNIVVNAGDAMSRGGTLLISTTNQEYDTDSATQHADLAPGRYVQLTVTDSGEGMSKEVLARAFEPFFTTKRAGRGTGLGLATAYGVVQQAGGRIAIYSEVGKGTTVRVLLPAPRDAVVTWAGPTKAIPADELTESAQTILLVEDEPAVRTAAQRILESRGYEVLQFGKPDEALALMSEWTKPIDLLLTDMVMPGMSGRELARRLRIARPTLQVIYMTGYSEELLRRDADGFEGTVIEKPFTRVPLLAAVARALSESATIISSS